jgi:hypothetical protein
LIFKSVTAFRLLIGRGCRALLPSVYPMQPDLGRPGHVG